MTTKKEETASFVIRFRQMIYDGDTGESEIQWRGNIRHVQGGDEKRFSEFEEVLSFMQEKLSELTIEAMEDKTPEEQKSIITKSFDLWKKMKSTGPKLVMDTIKDPKKQVANIQQQIHDQIQDVGDSIGEKFDLDVLKRFTGQDEEILQKLSAITEELSALRKQVKSIEKKLK
jgi:DNA repair ATPase RecN